jgi:hypothetical protein
MPIESKTGIKIVSMAVRGNRSDVNCRPEQDF